MARPKGIAPWKPTDAVRRLLGLVQDVLEEYHDHLPLTARQVFYRLVGQYGYDKTEQAYSRLCNHLVRARRALIIPFDSIRDDGTVERLPRFQFASVADFWELVHSNGERYKRERQANQRVFVELSCEAGGMVPQMEAVGHPYGVPVYSGGGFNSVTAIKELADRALERDVPTVLLHVGDFDPSGVSIFDSLGNDAALFVDQIVDARYNLGWDARKMKRVTQVDVQKGAKLVPVRVALTYDQVNQYDLPTAPPKGTDTRSANWPYQWTAQAEALPPDLLANIVRGAIEDQLDMEVFEEVTAHEAEERRQVLAGIEMARNGGNPSADDE